MPKDDEDNLVLRLLEKMRGQVADGFAETRDQFAKIDERFMRVDLRLADLQVLVVRTLGEVVAVSRRLDALESTRVSKLEAEVGAMRVEIAALKVAKQGGA